MKSDIGIETDRGILRLRFSKRISQAIYGKRQFYKSLGRHDTEQNRAWADRIALRIQQDLDHPDGLFDPTLDKYLGIPKQGGGLSLGSLWGDFCEWKKSTGQIGETTYLTRYKRTYQHWINPFSEEIISRGLIEKIRNTLMSEDHSKPHLKKFFSTLIAMGEWAVNSERLNKNLFKELGEVNFKIEKKSHQLQEEEDYRAFTLEERDLIIKSFYGSSRGIERQAAPLIEFLFLTGCRLGEAFALKWNDIKDNWILFDESYSTETKLTKSTKTNTVRIFKTVGYTKLLDLIERVKSRGFLIDKNDYVFIRENKKPFNRLNISAIWLGVDKSKNGREYYYDGVVTRLIKQKQIAQYLKPSSTRHTFITLQAQNGVDLKLLADSCGNSVDVIYNHYLGINRDASFLNL